MEFGLNGVHHPDIMQTLRGIGYTRLRVGIHTGGSIDQVRYVINNGYQPVVIIKDAAQVLEHKDVLWGCDVELWNEPDGTVDGEIAPSEYATMVPPFVDVCHNIGATPWIGSISNLHQKGLTWLDDMLWKVDARIQCGVSVHRYPVGRSWKNPHEGFGSRESEVRRLKSIIGDMKWAVTEFGFHTAPQLVHKWIPIQCWSWRWTDARVAEQLREEWKFWKQQGAEFACLYQITDGPTDTREDRFGVVRMDKTLKPSALSIQG